MYKFVLDIMPTIICCICAFNTFLTLLTGTPLQITSMYVLRIERKIVPIDKEICCHCRELICQNDRVNLCPVEETKRGRLRRIKKFQPSPQFIHNVKFTHWRLTWWSRLRPWSARPTAPQTSRRTTAMPSRRCRGWEWPLQRPLTGLCLV